MIAGRRITMLIGSFGLGGAERQALMVATGLVRRHQAVVSLAGLGPDGPVGEAARREGMQVVTLPRPESRWSALSWLKLRAIASRLAATTRPDATVAFTGPANVVAGFLARWHGIPAIWGQRDEGLARFPSWMERPALAACRLAVANGPGPRRFLLDQGLPAERIIGIPNGVLPACPSLDRPGWRTRLGLPADALVAVMLANLTRAKDHPTLLHAWAQVEAELPSAHLVLAGAPGDGAPMIDALVGSLGLGRVLRPGPVADVAGLLSACDLTVHCSRSEGQPNAVLEAMAAGLAVVASDIPGCRSVLGDDPDIAWIPPGAVGQLAAAILAFLGDAARRQRVGLRLRRRAADLFPPEAAIDAFATAIDRVLTGNG